MIRYKNCIILMLVLFLTGFISTMAEAYPDWLKGTICMGLFGTNSLEEKWPLEHYLYMLNFDSMRTDCLRIPDDAILTKEYTSDGLPVVIYSERPGNFWPDSESYHERRWREYASVRIVQACIDEEIEYRLGKFTADSWMAAEDKIAEDDEVLLSYFDFEDALAVLNVTEKTDVNDKKNSTEYYYLSYGLSVDESIEIQLIRETVYLGTRNRIILDSFPLEHDFGAWEFCISEAGNIVWYDGNKSWECLINGRHFTIHNSSIVSGTMCWKDNSSLLFFIDTRTSKAIEESEFPYTLMIQNNTCCAVEFLTSITEKKIQMDEKPLTMALNGDGSVLAVLTANLKLEMIHLDSGEVFEYTPWPFLSDNTSYGYCDEGIYLLPPIGRYTDYQTNIIWFPDVF